MSSFVDLINDRASHDWNYWLRQPLVADAVRQVVELSSVEPHKMAKREIETVAMSMHPRLGEASPFALMANDTHLLKYFYDTFLRRHFLVECLQQAVADEDEGLAMHVLYKISQLPPYQLREFVSYGGVSQMAAVCKTMNGESGMLNDSLCDAVHFRYFDAPLALQAQGDGFVELMAKLLSASPHRELRSLEAFLQTLPRGALRAESVAALLETVKTGNDPTCTISALSALCDREEAVGAVLKTGLLQTAVVNCPDDLGMRVRLFDMIGSVVERMPKATWLCMLRTIEQHALRMLCTLAGMHRDDHIGPQNCTAWYATDSVLRVLAHARLTTDVPVVHDCGLTRLVTQCLHDDPQRLFVCCSILARDTVGAARCTCMQQSRLTMVRALRSAASPQGIIAVAAVYRDPALWPEFLTMNGVSCAVKMLPFHNNSQAHHVWAVLLARVVRAVPRQRQQMLDERIFGFLLFALDGSPFWEHDPKALQDTCAALLALCTVSREKTLLWEEAVTAFSRIASQVPALRRIADLYRSAAELNGKLGIDTKGPIPSCAQHGKGECVVCPRCSVLLDLVECWSCTDADGCALVYCPRCQGHRHVGHEGSPVVLPATCAGCAPAVRRGHDEEEEGEEVPPMKKRK